MKAGRVSFLISIFLVGFIVLIIRLFTLSSFYNYQEIKRYKKRFISQKQYRGTIYDRNHRAIALSVEGYSVYAKPVYIKNISQYIEKLENILNISPDILREKLTSNKKFVWLKKNIDSETAQKLSDTKLPYIGIEKIFRRIYPDNFLFAQIVGFVGEDNIGLAGIEYSLNKELLEGKDIETTLDSNIQFILREELKKAYNKYLPKCAFGIVANAENGEILGMVSLPDFDPNEYQKYPQESYKNCNISNLIEPGSIMKMFVLAGALEEKVISIDDTFICNGKLRIKPGEYIKCTGIHGKINIFQATKVSCNITFIKIALRLGKEKLFKYLKLFGFLDKSLLMLPGEAKGILRKPSEWSYRSIYSIPIGQEIATTSVKLLENSLIFPNLGIKKRLKIIKKIGNENIQRKEGERVLSKTTALIVLKALEGVVEKGGTGKKAHIKGIKVMGKTGTAQKWIPGFGYQKVTAIFLGFIETSPKLSIIIVIDEPMGNPYAGEVSAPIFKKVAEKVIEYLNIEKEILKEKKLINFQKKGKREKIPKNKTPNFIGKTLRECLQIAKKYKVKIKSYGYGICYKQIPPPYSPMKKIVRIYLKEKLQ